MTETLNISITSDARDLFVAHDVQTVKKIKETALSEIENKKGVLRNFIGDNYKPILNTPPVLKEIQAIFDNTKMALSGLASLSHDFSNSENSPEKKEISPYAQASELYLKSLSLIKEKSFLEAAKTSFSAKETVEKIENKTFVCKSLTVAVMSLPTRIFSSIKEHITNPATEITDETLRDSFLAVSLLSKKGKYGEQFEFIENSLIERLNTFFSKDNNVLDLCNMFIRLLESTITFVSAKTDVKFTSTQKTLLIQGISDTFANMDIAHISKCELREIIRFAKSVEDSTRTVLGSPSLITYLKEMSMKESFWTTAFLPLFRKLAAQSLKESVDSLNVVKKISQILETDEVESFRATEFSLSNASELSIRALGLHPSITQFQREIESLVLLLSSLMQSQGTQIASDKMLKQPLISVLSEAKKVLEFSISTSPLTVYHLCGALCSPSVCSLLNEDPSNVLTVITATRESAANEWSKRKIEASNSLLSLVPTPGAGFTYLVHLEREILEAGGHIENQVLAKTMRSQAKQTVTAFFKEQLSALPTKAGSEAKPIYEKAAALYREYCLFNNVLSLQSTRNDLKSAFIQKMDPILYHDLEREYVGEAQRRMSFSGELVKLISGGRPTSPQKTSSTPTEDVLSKVEKLFSNL